MTNKKVIRVDFKKRQRIRHWSDFYPPGHKRPPHPHDFVLARFDSPIDLLKTLQEIANKPKNTEI